MEVGGGGAEHCCVHPPHCWEDETDPHLLELMKNTTRYMKKRTSQSHRGRLKGTSDIPVVENTFCRQNSQNAFEGSHNSNKNLSNIGDRRRSSRRSIKRKVEGGGSILRRCVDGGGGGGGSIVRRRVDGGGVGGRIMRQHSIKHKSLVEIQEMLEWYIVSHT